MQMKDLRPVSELARRYGAKCIAYGPPGTGKTPLIQTAPRPVLCASEPGMLSMRHVQSVPAWEANSPAKFDEFMAWLQSSAEAKNFDTIGIDSLSHTAQTKLEEELRRNKDGRKAYGVMHQWMMNHVYALYYMPQKHIYMISKQGIGDDGIKRPYFPGQALNTDIPHLFDEILHIDRVLIPGMSNGKPVQAIRSHGAYDALCRDRSGNLAELEPPDLGALFAKVMS